MLLIIYFYQHILNIKVPMELLKQKYKIKNNISFLFFDKIFIFNGKIILINFILFPHYIQFKAILVNES